jgi:energy-coupling factor transporter transmembrane protein EcfT
MIKISKDNLFFWRYFFGGGLIITHACFIVFVFAMNFWLMYLIYFFFAVMHFVVAKVWRYLFIVDTYISTDFKKIMFKNTKDEMIALNCDLIKKCSTYFGITDIIINDNGNVLKFYFMVNAKENLKYLAPGYS